MNQLEKGLTCTDETRTLVHDRAGSVAVDATTKKLVKRLHELQLQQSAVEEEIEVIQRSLKIAGIRLDGIDRQAAEDRYAMEQPFNKMTLSDACLYVLEDFNINGREWFTKTQVEYYLARGGFVFAAKDPKNSIDVTLRRLAADGRCIVERIRGSRGNRYRGVGKSERARTMDQISDRLYKYDD